MMKKVHWISLVLILAFLAMGATTARFEKTFRDSDGDLLTGSTIYIQNYSTSTTYTLAEVNSTTKPGVYRAQGVPHGLYKV